MSKRPTHAMPDDVRSALRSSSVADDYEARPHYQRNDYLGWIDRAKRAETRRSRIARMVAELKKGGVYMGMAHRTSAKA